MHNPTSEAIYEFIVIFIEQHGYPPTMREIADGCYISAGNVVRYLDKLEAERRLIREPRKARSLKLVRKVKD
jgi:repressor LexA